VKQETETRTMLETLRRGRSVQIVEKPITTVRWTLITSKERKSIILPGMQTLLLVLKLLKMKLKSVKLFVLTVIDIAPGYALKLLSVYLFRRYYV